MNIFCIKPDLTLKKVLGKSQQELKLEASLIIQETPQNGLHSYGAFLVLSTTQSTL